MRSNLAILAAVTSLLAMSGTALAAEEDRDDTVFNFGYDSEAGVLVWNQSPTDGLYDCTLENGPLNTTYTRVPDGVVLVDELTHESGMPVSFPARSQDTGESDPDSVEYTGPEGECALRGGDVAGPNGQLNHGMFMRLFNSMHEGAKRGCVVRHLAQSDLGRGDQQVRVGDVDPEAEIVDEGTIEFETAVTDCERGDGDKLTGQDRAAQNRLDKADRSEGQGPPTDKQRGKSGSAPGRNR